MHLYVNGQTIDTRPRRSRVNGLRFAAGRALAALCAALAGASIAVAAPAPHAGQGGGIDLQVTLGTDLSNGACGTDTQLDVTRLDAVNFCYTVTNQSNTTLVYQSLRDDVVGTILSAIPQPLAPGASYRYNRIVTARDSQSPTSTWSAYDVHPGYGYGDGSSMPDRVFADGFEGPAGEAPPYDFVDITMVGTPLNMDNDDGATTVPVGFAFSFYGLTTDQLTVGYNGGIIFDLNTGYFTLQNVPLPDEDLGAAILPYWTDIYYQQPEDGNIYTATLGDAPNRRFVTEWFNLPIMIGGIQQDSATFEVILFEGSNQILFQYADTDVGDPARNDGISATIGLNAPAGVDAALQYSYKTASVSAGTAILFSPTTPTTFLSTEQVVLAVGVPQIAVDPASFEVSAPAGGSTSATLDIGNVGNRPLTWSINAFSGGAHRPAVAPLTRPIGDPALTSAGPAPQLLHPANPASAHSTPVPQADGIPAFAIDLATSSLVTLNADDASDVTPIASVGDLILTAGAFVDEDFTQLYTIDYYTYHLLAVNTRSGEMTLVGTAELASGAGINWTSLAWDASTGTLYGMAYDDGRTGLSSYLYKVDPVTAETTLVGPITGIGDPTNGNLVSAIAIDTDGTMFGIELVGDAFVAIDKSSGEAQVVSSLGFDANYAQSLDFDDYTGTLYYAAFNNSDAEAEMYTIEPFSGALTQLSPIGADPTTTQLAAFAIARLGGVCAYPNDVPWLSFDLSSGSTAAGSSTPVNVTFDASTLAAGTYTGNICVDNNDLTNRRAAVPVTFTVQ